MTVLWLRLAGTEGAWNRQHGLARALGEPGEILATDMVHFLGLPLASLMQPTTSVSNVTG